MIPGSYTLLDELHTNMCKVLTDVTLPLHDKLEEELKQFLQNVKSQLEERACSFVTSYEDKEKPTQEEVQMVSQALLSHLQPWLQDRALRHEPFNAILKKYRIELESECKVGIAKMKSVIPPEAAASLHSALEVSLMPYAGMGIGYDQARGMFKAAGVGLAVGAGAWGVYGAANTIYWGAAIGSLTEATAMAALPLAAGGVVVGVAAAFGLAAFGLWKMSQPFDWKAFKRNFVDDLLTHASMLSALPSSLTSFTSVTNPHSTNSIQTSSPIAVFVVCRLKVDFEQLA
jgi:hypothetical protein